MRSMVEGARAIENILRLQETRQCKRPAHRTSCGPPAPLSWGGMKNASLFDIVDRMK